ncbi:aspartyl-phosphate phosphatase Spo0E family protein [Bacillus sp. AK128]
MRRLLIEIGLSKGFNSPEIMKISEELDKRIFEYLKVENWSYKDKSPYNVLPYFY